MSIRFTKPRASRAQAAPAQAARAQAAPAEAAPAQAPPEAASALDPNGNWATCPADVQSKIEGY